MHQEDFCGRVDRVERVQFVQVPTVRLFYRQHHKGAESARDGAQGLVVDRAPEQSGGFSLNSKLISHRPMAKDKSADAFHFKFKSIWHLNI
jgi:hypothetical protein